METFSEKHNLAQGRDQAIVGSSVLVHPPAEQLLHLQFWEDGKRRDRKI